MAALGTLPYTVTITVSPDTAAVLLRTAQAELTRDEKNLVYEQGEYDRAKLVLDNATKRLDAAKAKATETKAQVAEIERVTAPRLLVGTREYSSASRVGVKHTVTKFRNQSTGKDEYECTCEAFRFSKATPKSCKHTSRAYYDWFIQPQFSTTSLPKGYEFTFTGVKKA